MTQPPAPRRAYRQLPDIAVAAGRYSLRCVADEDIEPIRRWRNAQMDVLRQDRPISPEQQTDYFARAVWPQMDLAEPAQVLVTFFEHDERIGYGGLVHLAWPHRRAEISVLLRPDLAADAGAYHPRLRAFLSLVCELGFARLGLNRLYLETYAIRAAHIATLEACGFRLEGRLRDHVRIDGTPVDSLMHGRLAREWAAEAPLR